MPNSTPTVSVLLAVHNGEAHLVETLDTLRAQTFTDFELVAVDDGSTDGTAALLEHYASRDGRITVIRNDRNLGLPASLNRGIEMCRAPLAARADADDTYAPDRLARQVQFMNTHPDVGVLGCAFHRMDAAGHRTGTVVPPLDHAVIRARQLFMNSFVHSGVMFRTDVVRAAGGYDTAYWSAQDSDLWVRLRDRTRLANLPDPLVNVRVHGTSIMRTRGDMGQQLSLSVPQRLLSTVLDRPLSADDVRSVVTLYQGFKRMDKDDVWRGLPLLREVLDRVCEAEPAAARFLRREAADSLLKQGRRHPRADRPLVRALLAAAVALDPRVALTRPAAREAARALFPTP